jgi:6-pyruvoyltetrahydropterin/6-carboxytetrahydropterin synthase
MGEIKLDEITFSDQVRKEWSDPNLWQNLLDNKKITNPTIV